MLLACASAFSVSSGSSSSINGNRLSFLEANMRLEKRCDVAHHPATVGTIVAPRDEISELGRCRVQTLVLEQCLYNQIARNLGVNDVWKQQFLFFAKMRHSGGGEERQERRGRRVRVGRVRATAQTPRRDQALRGGRGKGRSSLDAVSSRPRS